MNKVLLNEIIKHIFSGFYIFSEDNNKFKSLRSKDFLLKEKVSFQDESGKEITNNVWGIELSIQGADLKILLSDCSITKSKEGLLEYCMLLKLKDNPAYGLYFTKSQSGDSSENYPLIAVSSDSSNWMTCNTYLQATLLAAMENVKDYAYSWNTCKDYKTHYDLMLSFIKYYNNYYGEDD